MKTSLLMDFSVDKANKQIKVERPFDAPLEMVWAAWTRPEILDQWWAPKPWQTRTKSMDFSVGGSWLYAMMGPEGETHWCRADYQNIEPRQSFTALDAFCDENGKLNESFPRSLWKNDFRDKGEATHVSIVISYEKLEDLEMIIQMGFKEGFTAGLENLDHYLSSHSRLRKENKTSN